MSRILEIIKPCEPRSWNVRKAFKSGGIHARIIPVLFDLIMDATNMG
jgi:hypothetical protein